jgi:hypothetical protein
MSAPASIPETHVAPMTNTFSGQVSSSPRSEAGSERAAPVVHAPQSERVSPVQKIEGDSRVVSAPRIGENPPEKERALKPAEPDLRRRMCEGGPCKEPAPTPAPPESDLRRRVCLNGPCTCPAGETSTKQGCVATVVQNPTQQCAVGQAWNGLSCVASAQCPAGQYWNGASCQPSQCPAGEYWDGIRCSIGSCTSINGRAELAIAEIRSLRSRTQQACSQNSSAQDCTDLKTELAGAIQRYEMLLNEATPACRTNLPNSYSL